MKIIIVDDEPLARSRLLAMVTELDAGEVVGEADNGADALRLVEQANPDIVLLDIRMPGMDGIEVARHLAATLRPPAVIFTTAYDSHALAAIESNAVDYLLKPIRKPRLQAALERATTLTRAQLAGLEAITQESVGGQSRARTRTHISATLHGNLQLLPLGEIRFFRAEHKYVTARHPAGQLIIEDTLSALETEFAERFVRVHRNALVAKAHVRGIERDANGHQYVRLDGIDDLVEVSRRLAPVIRRLLKSGGGAGD
jgi:two-component system, LytTR family, response regulator AlgR